VSGEIRDIEDIYSEEYHLKSGRRGEKQWPAKQDMARAVDEMFRPTSVIDVGCGRGWWMEYWARTYPGIRLVGLDGCARLIKEQGHCHENVRDLLHSCDLRRDWWWEGWMDDPFDLVMCIEVAEHLDEKDAPTLLSGLSFLGEMIFFSSAAPEQKGVHHVNCRPKGYWVEQFRPHGFRVREDLRAEWLGKLNVTGKYGQNIRNNALFFTRP